MKVETIFTIFLVFTMVACGQQSAHVAPATLSPAKPQITLSPIQSSTPKPTRMSIPTLPVATLRAMETQAAHWKFCGGNPEPNEFTEREFSPDGLWLAVSCQGQSEIDNYSFVLRLDGLQVFKIPFSEAYLQHQNGVFSSSDFTSASIYPHHWTRDSQKLFLIAETSRNWGSPGLFAIVGLYRLNVVIKEISPLIPLLPITSAGYEFRFSPDDEFLAYVLPDAKNEIRILSLSDAREQKIQVDNKYGNLLAIDWSPNSDKLMFYLTTSELSAEGYRLEDGQDTLFLYDLNSGEVATLLPDTQLFPIDWVSDTELLLETIENKVILQYKLDVSTRQLSLVAQYKFAPDTFERILITPTP